MKLYVKERLAMLQMLPENGSLSEMVDVMEIVKKIRITQEERTKIEYKETSGSIVWNISKDEGLDVDFTFEEISVLKDAVSRMDREKKINMSILDVCLRIKNL
jgi:hypothetical protein